MSRKITQQRKKNDKVRRERGKGDSQIIGITIKLGDGK